MTDAYQVNSEINIVPDEKVQEISDMFVNKYHDVFVEMAKGSIPDKTDHSDA